MDRCYKLRVLMVFLTCMLISTNLIYSNNLDINSNENSYPTQAQTVKQQKKEVINITNEELLLLSKLVTGEARGESYEGQVAVAAVVINPQIQRHLRLWRKHPWKMLRDYWTMAMQSMK